MKTLTQITATAIDTNPILTTGMNPAALNYLPRQIFIEGIVLKSRDRTVSVFVPWSQLESAAVAVEPLLKPVATPPVI